MTTMTIWITGTIRAMKHWRAFFVVPLGVGVPTLVLGRSSGPALWNWIVGADNRGLAGNRGYPGAACVRDGSLAQPTARMWCGFAFVGRAHPRYTPVTLGCSPRWMILVERLARLTSP